jgi:hypothetical protein
MLAGRSQFMYPAVMAVCTEPQLAVLTCNVILMTGCSPQFSRNDLLLCGIGRASSRRPPVPACGIDALLLPVLNCDCRDVRAKAPVLLLLLPSLVRGVADNDPLMLGRLLLELPCRAG